MNRTKTLALAGAFVAVAGVAVLAGTSWAGRGFGPHGGMMMMAGPAMEIIRGFDGNGDHALSQEEIDAAVGARTTQFDADADGQLSLAEFQLLWADMTKPLAVRAFQFLDPNGDASVAKAELADRFGSVVATFDRNEDGVLSPADRPHGGRGGRDRDE